VSNWENLVQDRRRWKELVEKAKLCIQSCRTIITIMEKRKERDNWEDLGIEGSIMSKYILKNRLIGRGLGL
jgi:hypothetical protein